MYKIIRNNPSDDTVGWGINNVENEEDDRKANSAKPVQMSGIQTTHDLDYLFLLILGGEKLYSLPCASNTEVGDGLVLDLTL